MKLRPILGLCALSVSLLASPVRGAFELEDASPGALGSASLEAPAAPMASPEESGFRATASHANLFQAPDLVAERITLETRVPGGRCIASWSLVRAPGARESSASLAWSQEGASPLRLGARVERLDFVAEGAASIGGFAAGASAAARIATARVALEGGCEADRLLRSAGLEQAGVRPALTVGVACVSRGARIRYAERWDAAGTRSPRLILDLPVGRALTARFGRGGGPGRVGVALAARIKRLEISWGRLDFASGGTITAVGVAWVGRPRGSAADSERGDGRTGSPDRVTIPDAREIPCRPQVVGPPPRREGAPEPVRPFTALPAEASLLALMPSAIMRRCGRIRPRRSAFRAAAQAVPVAAAALLASVPARADSSSVWLPPAREDVEAVERLDEPPTASPARGSVLARWGRSGAGTWRVRRLAAAWSRPGAGARAAVARSVELGVVEAEGAPKPTLALSAGAIRVAAGRLTLEQTPWLLSRRLALARAAARVPEPRVTAARSGAPVGASTPAAGGLAAEWTGRRISTWALAGRDVATSRPVGTAGGAIRGRRIDASLGIGRSRAGWCFLTAGTWRSGPATASLEMLLGAGRPAVSAAAGTRGPGLALWCRWRMLPGEARPAAGEAGATTRGRVGSVRLTWRSWTPAARADNGALELETATKLGAGRAIRARVGERSGGAGSAAGASPQPGRPERYAVLDVTLARAGSRSLAFFASFRRTVGGARTGRMLGTRFRAGAEGGSRLTLLVQATRTGAGASAPGPELNASGQSTLAERSRSGIVFAARGVARRGPLEMGGVWQREEDADGARPRSATVWMRWYL